MKLVTLVLVCLILVNDMDAIPLGIIHNASLTTYSNTTMNVSQCHECLCAMFASPIILALNCFANYSSGVVCQLFTNTTYCNASASQIETNLNSIFYFRQLPLNNQSKTIPVPVMTTAKHTTTRATLTTTHASTTLSSTICPAISTTTATNTSSLPLQCSNYTSIIDLTRNAIYNGSGGCDNATFKAVPTWVRFFYPGGTILANCPIAPFHCGANAPGWYSGVYPSTAGGTKNGTVCHTWTDGSTCIYPTNISITNCNGYYVFALTRTTTCSLRYCTI